jgi:hypothetical protein
MDNWHGSKVTRTEQPEFKANLKAFYNCEHVDDERKIKCMILGGYFDSRVVRASHIWKACTLGAGLEEFQLEDVDLYNERNGLLLHENIEKKFDVKEVCFLYNALVTPNRLTLKVLNPVLLDMNVVPGTTYGSIDGHPLLLPDGVYPFRRILSFHAKCSIKFAKKMGWIEKEYDFEPFFTFSDGASEPSNIE